MNISFSGCGFLGIYHVGVASCFRVHAPHLIDDPEFKVLGTSAGAIAAVCLVTNCPLGEVTSYWLRISSRARARALGPLHPSFHLVKMLKDGLHTILPDNAYELCSNKVYISMTRVADKANVIVSQYESNEDLIEAILCSAHIPFYSGLLPPTYKGVRYVDGVLTDNLPVFDDNTVTVSPFCGEMDICPNDSSANFLHLHLANTSVQCSSNNLYRLSLSLFPPHPEMLSEMCRQGFDDALKYLQKNALIGCVHHFSIKSSISQCPAEKEDISTDDHDSKIDHVDHDPDTCHDCKKKVEVAHQESLPLPVAGALQAACDSVNSTLYRRMINGKFFRLLSLVTSPLCLPIDMAYNYTIRLLEWLPHIPSDMRWALKEIIWILKSVKRKIEQRHQPSLSRYMYQVAINDTYPGSESGYVSTTQEDVATYTTSTYLPKSQKGDEEFASEDIIPLAKQDPVSKTISRVSHMRHVLEEEHPHHLKVHARNPHRDFHGEISMGLPKDGSTNKSDFHGEISMGLPKDGSSNKGELCEQMVDTFEHCLHEANQQEAVLAYYYLDENQKLKVTEIFSVPTGAGSSYADTSEG